MKRLRFPVCDVLKAKETGTVPELVRTILRADYPEKCDDPVVFGEVLRSVEVGLETEPSPAASALCVLCRESGDPSFPQSGITFATDLGVK